MNQQDINQLLRELTPEVRGYLFPGLFSDDFFDKSFKTNDCILYEKKDDRLFKGAVLFPSLKKEQKAPGCSIAAAEIPDTDADKLNARTELLLEEIRRLQEKYHVSIDELESLLGYTVKLSPLRIMRSGKMFLSDYNNTEIRMPNVAKALFFLYLRHPEGLRFKDVADHKKELVDLYGNITGRDNPDEIEKSIDLLADPFSNALNVNASRIKTAFRNAVSDRIARHYYINGAAGEIKKVPLNRDLVIWEH